MTRDDGTLVTKAEYQSGGLTGDAEKGSIALEGDELKLEHETKPVDGPLDQISPGFSLTRNGDDLEGAAKIGELIHGLVTLERQIQEIMNFIRDFQPQVGWKLVFEIELFKGDLSYEWGYKEWNDHTVFEWWKVEVGMTLFALKLELSFGADLRVCGFGITALIFGNVSVDAAVKASKEATPDDSAPLAIGVEGGPKGQLGIRSALGADWITAEGTITVGLTFEGELKCGDGEGLHIPWVLNYDGVEAQVTGSVRWVGSISKKWTLSDGQKPWKRGRFL